MAYFEGKFVTIYSPAESRAIDIGLELYFKELRRDGIRTPPTALLQRQSEFHQMWADSAEPDAVKPDETSVDSQNGSVAMMDVMDASRVLGMTRQGVYKAIRSKRLPAVQLLDGTWRLESTAVEALVADRKRGHA